MALFDILLETHIICRGTSLLVGMYILFFKKGARKYKLVGTILIKYKKERGIEGLKSENGTDSIYFMSAVEDASGNLWMATYNEGVWKYNGKEVIHYSVKEGTNSIKIFSIYKDKVGELWLGTQ